MIKKPVAHTIYTHIRPILQDAGILNLARILFPQRLRTAVAVRLGLKGFNISTAEGHRMRRRLRANRHLQPHLSGINYVGDPGAAIGISQNSRVLMRALEATQLPIAFTKVAYPLAKRDEASLNLPTGHSYDISIIDIHFHYLYDMLQALPPGVVEDKYRIGVWHWELDRLPPEAHKQFELLDEIWTISGFVRDVVARDAPIPVVCIPPAIHRPEAVAEPRQLLGLPQERVIFLSSFDLLSSIARKNPFAAIEAFQRAFGAVSDKPLLVMKTHHTQLLGQRGAVSALHEAVRSIGGIMVEEYLTRSEMDALLAACDCYVSLHRSEGFGFGMAEAMLLGKPVIATAYSGNLDFMTPHNSYGVHFTLRPVQASDHQYQPEYINIYPPGYLWAEPDIDHAAELMREVVDSLHEARMRGQQAAYDVATKFNVQTSARRIRARLEAISHG